MATTKGTAFPGVHPRALAQLPAGIDMPKLIRLFDARGRYRRPCFDSDGRPTGAFDETIYPVRGHFAMVNKGFTLEELVRDMPEAPASGDAGGNQV